MVKIPGQNTAPLLKVEGLVKNYGKRRVVDGVSFHVNSGEIVGLLGPNGAGKTTTFRMTCGLIKTDGGVVYLGGNDVTHLPMYRRSLDGGMGYLPQAESVFRGLSVQDNLLSVMELLGMPKPLRQARCDELLGKFRLTPLRRNLGSGLSGGERRRLEIARALVSQPRIMLLDEPFANIDPVTIHSIQEIIRQLSAEGIAILITDHQVRETLAITHRGYIIREGKVLCHGTPAEVLSNAEARKVYFGESVAVGDVVPSVVPQVVGLVEVPDPPSAEIRLATSVTSRHAVGSGVVGPPSPPRPPIYRHPATASIPAPPVAPLPPQPSHPSHQYNRDRQQRDCRTTPRDATSRESAGTASEKPSPKLSAHWLNRVNTFLWGSR